MSERDIKKLIDLAKKKLNETRTKKVVLDSLISAGILTKNGNYTKPYRSLSRLVKR